jgi:hypothetical protein
MKKFLLPFLPLFISFTTHAQHPCYSFNNKDNAAHLKIGVGKFFNMSTDNDGNDFTTVFIETDMETWGAGLQTDIRVGDNYINWITPSPTVSVDTRIIGYGKLGAIPQVHLGGFTQFNSTAMWLDGIQIGGLVRYQLEKNMFGFVLQSQLPFYGMQKRAINIDLTEKSNTALGILSNGIEKTRKTEYRIMAAVFVKINTPANDIKRSRRR